MAELCVICLDTEPTEYTECFHKFCKTCVKQINSCATCRYPFSQEFINSIEDEPIDNTDNNIIINNNENIINNITIINIVNPIRKILNITTLGSNSWNLSNTESMLPPVVK